MNYRGQILNKCYIFSRKVNATAIYEIWELRSVYSAGIFFLYMMIDPVFRLSPAAVERFKTRFLKVAGTKSDNIIYPIEMGELEERLYVVFIKPEGYPVGDWRGFYYQSGVKSRYFRDYVRKVFPLAFDIVRAVTKLHEEGSLFNQINPMNVWISGDPDYRAVYLKSFFSEFYDFSDKALLERLENPVIYGGVRIDSIHLGNQPHAWDYVSLGLMLFHLLSSINPERFTDRTILKTEEFVAGYLDPLEKELSSLVFGILQTEDKKAPLNELCRNMLQIYSRFRIAEPVEPAREEIPAEPSNDTREVMDAPVERSEGNFLVRFFRKLFNRNQPESKTNRRGLKSIFQGFRWGLRRQDKTGSNNSSPDVRPDEMEEAGISDEKITIVGGIDLPEAKMVSPGYSRSDAFSQPRIRTQSPAAEIILPAQIPYSQELLTRDRTRAILEALNAHYIRDNYVLSSLSSNNTGSHTRLPERTAADYRDRETVDYKAYVDSRSSTDNADTGTELPAAAKPESGIDSPDTRGMAGERAISINSPVSGIPESSFLDLEPADFDRSIKLEEVFPDMKEVFVPASVRRYRWSFLEWLRQLVFRFFNRLKKNRSGQ